MKILAVKLYENGFLTEPLVMGGDDGEEHFDPSRRLRSSLQNFLIDTGSEVILVDTGMPSETPDTIPDEKTKVYIGRRIDDYVTALKKLGYTPDDVTRILVTHKHADHTGELRSFPNARIYISPEDADALDLKGDNIVRVSYRDGAFYNFPAHEKIADGVYFIEAKGHTRGNSIVIAEDNGLFYMMHGDVTYSDEALYANRLSIIFEDKDAARNTLDNVRTFVQEHPTVYCSTHTPLGYENLEARRVVDLSNPPEFIAPESTGDMVMDEGGRYVCPVCGYCYDPAVGDPDHGIAPGTAFADLPDTWKCPRCKQPKEAFSRTSGGKK